jgi:hypothetical protein
MRIARSVTTGRYISTEISDIRNTIDVADPGAVPDAEYREEDTTPNRCHWCREPFAPGRMRYPVKTAVDHSGGWGLASVCMDCFKNASIEEAWGCKRYHRNCRGCGEPMLTPVDVRGWPYEVCSNRCYQRCYRRSRRGQTSTVPWKAHTPRCEACREPILGRKRADAKFCSGKCRQAAYRTRACNASDSTLADSGS